VFLCSLWLLLACWARRCWLSRRKAAAMVTGLLNEGLVTVNVAAIVVPVTARGAASVARVMARAAANVVRVTVKVAANVVRVTVKVVPVGGDSGLRPTRL